MLFNTDKIMLTILNKATNYNNTICIPLNEYDEESFRVILIMYTKGAKLWH
jgi:hypothetical protein